MVKFFLFLYSVASFCAAYTEIAASKAESEAFADVAPSSTYAYAEATSKRGHPTESKPHNSKRSPTNENCENVDNIKGALNCSLPNESPTCVTCPLVRTCRNRKERYHFPLIAPNATCSYNCTCNDGFYRNDEGFCVTSDLCDKKCSGPNEEYKADKKKCPPEVCQSIISRYACDPKEIGQPGCVCKSGFLRLSLNSSCIPTNECPELANQPPVCSLPNESLKCVKSCPRPRTCATRNIRYKCPNNGNETCKLGCVCDDGFYRNSDGFCVTYDLCDKECTGPNEEYKPDKKTCPLEQCPFKLGVIRFACNPHEVGQPGCACKPGFRRLNFNLTCVPIEECPGQGIQNSNCRDDEIFNKCPSEDCEYCPTCDKEARKCTASSSVKCPPAKCTCRYNYKRLSNGTCVSTRDCPPFKCSKPNEQFDSCPLCPSDDCERATASAGCPGIGFIGIPLLCRPSCRCTKNYWRNGDRCVPYEECPNIKKMLQCNQPNEVWKCVKPYPPQRTCKNRGSEENCSNNKTELCKYDCVCNDGFYRNDDGYCVTSELCDKKCLGPNEIYKSYRKTCPPETCESILARYKCDSKEKGQPGCVCKPDYLRLNASSTCIFMSDCPQYLKPKGD